MMKPSHSDSLGDQVCAKETRISWAAGAERGSVSIAPFAQGVLAF